MVKVAQLLQSLEFLILVAVVVVGEQVAVQLLPLAALV
jgi:hypothetical protein